MNNSITPSGAKPLVFLEGAQNRLNSSPIAAAAKLPRKVWDAKGLRDNKGPAASAAQPAPRMGPAESKGPDSSAQNLLSHALKDSASDSARLGFRNLCQTLGGSRISADDLKTIVQGIVFSLPKQPNAAEIDMFIRRLAGVDMGVGHDSSAKAFAFMAEALSAHPHLSGADVGKLAWELGERLEFPERVLNGILTSRANEEAIHRMTRAVTSSRPYNDVRGRERDVIDLCAVALHDIVGSRMSFERIAECAESLCKGLVFSLVASGGGHKVASDALSKMLDSVRSCTPVANGAQAAVQGLSRCVGGPQMDRKYFDSIVRSILLSPPNAAMLSGFCRGLGGSKIGAGHLRELTLAVLNEHAVLKFGEREVLMQELARGLMDGSGCVPEVHRNVVLDCIDKSSFHLSRDRLADAFTIVDV